jgi:hypothetical protein
VSHRLDAPSHNSYVEMSLFSWLYGEVTSVSSPTPAPPQDVPSTSWLTKLAPRAAAQEQSIVAQDRVLFAHFLLSTIFTPNCTCDTCSPCLYNTWPLSCAIQHHRSDLMIRRNEDPATLCARPEMKGEFEAQQLAASTVAYFSRDEAQMSAAHEDALREFRAMRGALFEKLDVRDCSTVSQRVMLKVMKLFNDIFFMGAISPKRRFTWDAEALVKPVSGVEWLLGHSCTLLGAGGRVTYDTFMSPTRLPYRMGVSLVAARLGTLLHEMLYAFLSEWACRGCYTALDNAMGHGRAWHRITIALDECASHMLNAPGLDLGRLEEIQNAYMSVVEWRRRRHMSAIHPGTNNAPSGISPTAGARCEGPYVREATFWIASIHDIQSFGFM